MKLKFVSDFHTEFWGDNPSKFGRIMKRYFPYQEDDKETTLCILGDLGKVGKYDSTIKLALEILSERFKEVIFLAGNHFYYDSVGVFGNDHKFFRDNKLPDNVTFLEDQFVIIDDVVFIGTTLWSDFNKKDYTAMEIARIKINDYKYILKEHEVIGCYGMKMSQATLIPTDTYNTHKKSVEYLTDTLEMFLGTDVSDMKKELKVVVLTHHAPCELSIPEQYKGDETNGAYYSDLSDLIFKYQPLFWCHGHCHTSSNYELGDTKVICNPLGYHGHTINKKFDPKQVFEI